MGTIAVTNLGKAYKQYPTRWSRLAEWVLPGRKPRHHLKWVLQDINFTVNPGEAVGIIGINGAGKSTLLKMITGTTQPTQGSVHITGRVAALLELGMGFHPDFTGRQNVYTAGQLLGYQVEEIAELMPEIEKFAEIGEYIEEPVRVYSSGMQVRLAFSLATAKRPDILIVDEALSVGDAYFQHKCFDRIRQFSESGTSLLFVSHDPGAVKNLCDRAILLNAGRIEHLGDPDNVLDYYNALLADGRPKAAVTLQKQAGEGIRSGNRRLAIESVELYSASEPAYVFEAGATMDIRVAIKVIEPVQEFCVGLSIRDRFGNVIIGTNTELLKQNLKAASAGELITAEFQLPKLGIGAGSYSVSMALHDPRSHVVSNYDWWDKAVLFEVVQNAEDSVVGVCHFPVQFRMLNSEVCS